MDWLQLLTLLGTLLGAFLTCFGFLFREMRRIEERLDRKVESAERGIELQSERIVKESVRTDRLYEMFIDLVKERK